jgi:hypothetical protein
MTLPQISLKNKSFILNKKNLESKFQAKIEDLLNFAINFQTAMNQQQQQPPPLRGKDPFEKIMQTF